MPRFENLSLVYTTVAIPLCIAMYLLTRRWKKSRIRRFGETELVSKLMPAVSQTKALIKFILFLLAVSAVIVALLNPQTGARLEHIKRKGAQIIIALDVSNSMKAEDLTPNRLERAKQAISRLIDKLEGDEVGLIVFAGKAYVQLPVTTDYASAQLFLDNVDTDIIPTQGTSVSAAIDLAIESFSGEEGKNKALIIITDGEDHEGGVTESASLAVKKGIVIHTIGLGSPDGVPIPAFQGKVRNGFRKDRNGTTIITRLNEQVLKEVASAGHGTYIHGSNNEIGLNNLLSEINNMDKQEFEGKVFKEYDDYFFYFAWVALLVLLVESLISERKSKLYERLNLFGEKK